MEHDDTRKYTEQDYETFEAINCLAEIKSQAAVEPLTVLASANFAKDDRERWMSIRALGIIGNRMVIPQIIPLIYHYNWNSRPWAQITLVRLSCVKFQYDWMEWVRWWNEQNIGTPMDDAKVRWQVASDVTDAERTEFLDPKADSK